MTDTQHKLDTCGDGYLSRKCRKCDDPNSSRCKIEHSRRIAEARRRSKQWNLNDDEPKTAA